MNIHYEKYGFYVIDIAYVKYLHSKDSEVFYNTSFEYGKKPYLGIIANLGGYQYCIPLTSAKQKHLNWKNISEDNYIIYENVEEPGLRKNDVHKKIGEVKRGDDKVSIHKKILAVLDIKKMIPVNDTLYSYIEFSNETDVNYRILLQKEYDFLLPYKNDILKKASKIYLEQKESKHIKNFHCNFSLLESAYKEYINPVVEY